MNDTTVLSHINFSSFEFTVSFRKDKRPNVQKLCRILEYSEGRRMRKDGDHAILDDASTARPYLISCDQASVYTHDFSVPLISGDPAIVQFGSTTGPKPLVPHLRVCLSEKSGNIAEVLVRLLWEWIHINDKFGDQQIRLTQIKGNYLLKGLRLENVYIENTGKFSFSTETVVTKTRQICGYQFGQRLASEDPSELPPQPFTRTVPKPSEWQQTREIAMYDQEQRCTGLPVICVSWQLALPMTYDSLKLQNPFEGLSVRQRTGAGNESVVIEPWKSRGAWAVVWYMLPKAQVTTANTLDIQMSGDF